MQHQFPNGTHWKIGLYGNCLWSLTVAMECPDYAYESIMQPMGSQGAREIFLAGSIISQCNAKTIVPSTIRYKGTRFLNLEAFVLLWLCCVPYPVTWLTLFLKKSVIITDSLLLLISVRGEWWFWVRAQKHTSQTANLLAKPSLYTIFLTAKLANPSGFTN